MIDASSYLDLVRFSFILFWGVCGAGGVTSGSCSCCGGTWGCCQCCTLLWWLIFIPACSLGVAIFLGHCGGILHHQIRCGPLEWQLFCGKYTCWWVTTLPWAPLWLCLVQGCVFWCCLLHSHMLNVLQWFICS